MKFLTAILLLLLVSCSNKTTIKKDQNKSLPKQETIEMSPIIIKKDEVKSIFDMFKEANDFVISEDYESAIKIYKELETIISKEDRPLLDYNMAVTYFKMKKFEKSLKIYLKLLKENINDTEFLEDIIINITEIYSKDKQWNKITKLIEKYKDKFSFETNKWDYIELLIRYEIALYNLKNFDEAEFTALKAYAIFKKHKKMFSFLSKEQRYFLSMGYFYIGEITKNKFENIKIKGNVKETAVILDKKTELLLRAQNYYINGMNFKDKYWATACGFRIGEMYDTFYNQVVKADLNEDLTFEERIIYKEEIKIRIQNLLKKAIAIFKENIMMSERINEKNLWIEKTLKRLKDARKKYLQIKKLEIEREL